jgi:hypothetical protein
MRPARYQDVFVLDVFGQAEEVWRSGCFSAREAAAKSRRGRFAENILRLDRKTMCHVEKNLPERKKTSHPASISGLYKYYSE